MKIAFTGLPSSGKTTLAKKVAEYTGGVYVPEMARTYINATRGKPDLSEQIIITRMQSALENELTDPDRITVCDVPVFLGDMYYRLYH